VKISMSIADRKSKFLEELENLCIKYQFSFSYSEASCEFVLADNSDRDTNKAIYEIIKELEDNKVIGE